MEILEQLKLLKQLFSYGLIGQIVIAIGLLIIFFYQRHKIGSLEMQIKSQKGILDSAEKFITLFNPERLRGYGELVVEKVTMEKESEFKKIREDFEEKLKKQDLDKHPEREFYIVVNAYLDVLSHLPNEVKNKVIDGMQESKIKDEIKGIFRCIEEAQEEEEQKAIEKLKKKGVLPLEFNLNRKGDEP
jgi:hypothetical protein